MIRAKDVMKKAKQRDHQNHFSSEEYLWIVQESLRSDYPAEAMRTIYDGVKDAYEYYSTLVAQHNACLKSKHA